MFLWSLNETKWVYSLKNTRWDWMSVCFSLIFLFHDFLCLSQWDLMYCVILWWRSMRSSETGEYTLFRYFSFDFYFRSLYIDVAHYSFLLWFTRPIFTIESIWNDMEMYLLVSNSSVNDTFWDFFFTFFLKLNAQSVTIPSSDRAEWCLTWEIGLPTTLSTSLNLYV